MAGLDRDDQFCVLKDKIKKIDWTLPLKTISEANISQHWTAKKKRHDQQKRMIGMYWLIHRPSIKLPCEVILTRLAPGRLDSDNLPVSMKWIRDSIANHLISGLPPGRADDSPLITWTYSQQKSKVYQVNVIINEIIS
jgi:hypothetical protein